VNWKRLRDQTGKPKGFGFAEYADPDSALRALRVLGGEGGSQGVTLQALDGSDIKKKLIVSNFSSISFALLCLIN
jgi:RNA-binding protein 25